MTVTAGVRVDVPRFGDTAFPNPAADALTFRDADGSPVQYSTGALPETTPCWSPRMGFNWDVTSDGTTQVRGGTGLFSGKPPYVWISNQIGNTGVLFGFLNSGTSTGFPFNPNPDKYKPAPTGTAASSYELDVTDKGTASRRRSNQCRRRPSSADGPRRHDGFHVRQGPQRAGVLNANLPAPESAYTGVDNRVRWVANAQFPACITNGGPFGTGGQVGPCVTRLNNAVGNSVTAAYVLKNSNDNHSWNISGALSKPTTHGFSAKFGFNYGVSRSLVEPSSTAGTSCGVARIQCLGSEQPPLAYSTNSPGKRVFLQASHSKQHFHFGATTVSMFYDGHTNGNTSFVFAGDANGDTVSGNDLIYIPRNTSEMNFKPLNASATVSRALRPRTGRCLREADYGRCVSEQASRRVCRAQRGVPPFVNRIDLSIIQDLFHSVGRARHSGQVRLDITNIGNLLNSNWGSGTRLINTQILTSPTADPKPAR